MNQKHYKEYWDSNIEKWSDLYLEISHGQETLRANKLIGWLYNRTVARLEASLMKTRYALTTHFLNRYLFPGATFCDIGCGTGIFTVHALNMGASVKAIDVSKSSLNATQKNVQKNATIFSDRLELLELDIQNKHLPVCDVSLAMGVFPYIGDYEAALKSILSASNVSCIQISSSENAFNKLRQSLPWLNVRKLIFHSSEDFRKIILSSGCEVLEDKQFATGFIFVTKKK